MQFDIDLNDFSGGPNWLSPAGKVDRAGIRAKHRAAYFDTLEPKPASPETLATLDAIIAAQNTRVAARTQAEADIRDGKDPHRGNIAAVFTHAVHIIDQTEPVIRDMIESDLMDVAGFNGVKVRGTVKIGKLLAAKIAVVRTKATKEAFRYLRDYLPSDDPHAPRKSAKTRLTIYGKSLAEWAQQVAVQEGERIKTAISVGLTAGEDNTDIAHRVIGSRRGNGVEGATEITRQHFLRLGKGLLHKRKTRMRGDSVDVHRVK